MTPDQASDAYYQLRREHNRPSPRQLPRHVVERDAAHFEAFLRWCQDKQITDPAGYMRERFRHMGSKRTRRRALPRPNQLRNDRLAERWCSRIEGERIAEQSYEKRMDGDDTYALLIKSLAAAPLQPHESFKRRLTHLPTACLAQPQYSGGHHPQSAVCQLCPCAAACVERLKAMHGFDVSALREGRVDVLPAKVASAYVR